MTHQKLALACGNGTPFGLTGGQSQRLKFPHALEGPKKLYWAEVFRRAAELSQARERYDGGVERGIWWRWATVPDTLQR